MCNNTTWVSSLASLDRETDVPHIHHHAQNSVFKWHVAHTLQNNCVFSRMPTISYGADFLSGSVMCKLLERLIVIKDHIASLKCDDKDFIN